MSLFRTESLESIASPEQINDYIRVGNPGIWLALTAIVLLLGGGIFWGATAAIPSTVSFQAISEAGDQDGRRYTAFLPLETAQKLKPGMEARLENVPARIAALAETPLSSREAAGLLAGRHRSDYIAHILGISEWNIVVTLQTDEPPGGEEAIKSARVTTGIDRPLDFLINSAAKKEPGRP